MVTVAEIASRLGVPSYRVDFYLRTRNIAPIQRAGNVRLFSNDIVLQVAGELAKRQAKKQEVTQ